MGSETACGSGTGPRAGGQVTQRVASLLLVIALLVAVPCFGQSLAKSFYTADEWRAAVEYGTEAHDQVAELARELHQAYLAESMEDFAQTLEEHQALSRQWIEGVFTEASFRERVTPLCASYAQRQSRRDSILLSDLRMLLGAADEEWKQFESLIDRLRVLRPDAEGGGHCHPLLGWSNAFADEPLPAAAAEICQAYSRSIDALLAESQGLAAAPRGRTERAGAAQVLRQLRISASIDARSDSCAEQLASLLAPGEARRFLHTYYRLRAPKYFNTSIDARLTAIDRGRLDAGSRRRLEEYHARYWQTLRRLNRKVMDAHADSAEAGIEISIKESTEDLDAARVVVIEARTEREEQLKLLFEELERMLSTF